MQETVKQAVIELLSSRGAERVPHPGGNLLDHLQRTARRLESWGAAPALVAAGLCHASYGTRDLLTPLLQPSERELLCSLIGEHAESIVYAYCADDRSRPLAKGTALRDRFTGEQAVAAGWLASSLAELTAANELDVVQHAALPAAMLQSSVERLNAHVPELSRAARADLRTVSQVRVGDLAAVGGDPVLAYRELGTHGAHLLLWHGGAPPELTWARQRELASALRVCVPWRRGYAPSRDSMRQDWEVDARDLLRIMPGQVHVVAHSIGALSALVAASLAPERFASLVLIEPPLSSIAKDDPEVQRLVALAQAFIRGEPSAREAFLALASLPLDHAVTARIERRARGLRDPAEAAPALAALREARVPIAIVSGMHADGIERQCDALHERLGGQRWQLPGAGHAVQRHREFNGKLLDFLSNT